MRARAGEDFERSIKFFRLILSHAELTDYFKTNFLLMYLHKFSISDLEDMMPWERDVYISLLSNYLDEKEKKKKNNPF